MTPSRPRAAARTPDHEGAIASAPYLRPRRVNRSRGHLRPRVLQLLATGGTGGAQESYTELLLHLNREKYEVSALSLSRGSAVQRLRRLGVEVDVIDEADDAAAVRALASYLRLREIDVIHAHMYRAEVVGTRAGIAAGTPVVMATVHSSRQRSPEDVATLAALTPSMDRLIVPSQSIAGKIRREGRGSAPYTVIPNGVDLARFAAPAPPCSLRDEFAIPCTDVLIGVVARLEPEKGHRYLIEAMPSILAQAPPAPTPNGVWLAIVGEGSLEADLRALARSLPSPASDRIIFTGRRDDISALTADLDIAVLPSLREAQGISILEAMARRKPVVASEVGGVPEVVTDGIDGLLVPPESSAALADALGRLVASPALREQLGDAGYETVAHRFSMDAMVRRMEETYDEELLRSGAGAALQTARAGESPAGPREPASPPGRAALEIPPV